jgi:hypothetical protein
MFVIVQDNQVVLGPMRWNKYRFENFLAEEYEVTATLPQSNDPETMFTVNDSCVIYPVQGSPDPIYNPVIEMLHGPFWDFSNDLATSSYQVQPIGITAVKNMLIERTVAERYRREIAGISVTIQGTDVSVETDRDTRNILYHTYLITTDTNTVQWKFPNSWMTLTRSDLESVVVAINNYIQEQFAWESAKVAEINACETLDSLSVVTIEKVVSTTNAG